MHAEPALAAINIKCKEKPLNLPTYIRNITTYKRTAVSHPK